MRSYDIFVNLFFVEAYSNGESILSVPCLMRIGAWLNQKSGVTPRTIVPTDGVGHRFGHCILNYEGKVGKIAYE